jgi:hypothetical protein
MSSSFGISLLGCSRYIIFEMVDYSFASYIKFVPTLYLSTSPAEYCDWKDTMEDFLWDRDLKSCMKNFFANRTFSKQVLQLWINLQQQNIARGGDPCQTWRGMKVILQCRFDPPLKPEKKIDVASGTKWLDSKQDVHSSENDSVIGEECLKKLTAQDVKILHPKTKLGFVESSSFPTKQDTFSTHGSICKERNIPQCVETPNKLLHCKNKKVVASKNLA